MDDQQNPQTALNANRMNLTEYEAKSLCKKYSIPTPNYELVRSEAEAEKASKSLGLPIVASGFALSYQGIGKTQASKVSRFVSSEKLELMRKIKSAFDPNKILNPGTKLQA